MEYYRALYDYKKYRNLCFLKTMKTHLVAACIVVACVVVMLTRIYPMSPVCACNGGHVVLSNVCIRNTITMATQEVELAKNFSLHNWIILVTVNAGYLDFFQNWFWYFRRHQLNVSVIVIAEENVCFEKLNQLYNNTSHSVTIERSGSESTGSAADFNSAQFNKLVGQRPTHILKYLQLGYNVLYSDTDTVWLKNPFPHLIGEFDILAQLDNVSHCTGFLAIMANQRTLQFVGEWRTHMKKRTTTNDQVGFLEMDKSGLCIQGLNTDFFPAGFQYFDLNNNTGYSNAKYADAVVVHNNYIIGHDKKRARFKKLNLWH